MKHGGGLVADDRILREPRQRGRYLQDMALLGATQPRVGRVEVGAPVNRDELATPAQATHLVVGHTGGRQARPKQQSGASVGRSTRKASAQRGGPGARSR
jgi:hypothetical protein